MTALDRPQFGELPETGRGRGSGPTSRWEGIAAELVQHPGEWARVAEKDSGNQASVTASDIRWQRLVAFRDPPNGGHFDATARGEDVWARFVPAGQQ